MKAAQITSFGDLSVISVVDVEIPEVKPGFILVENYAGSINPIDWKVRAGYIPNLQFPIILGGDFAGKVLDVGEGVTEFKKGDEVYGQAGVLNGGSGSFTETILAKTKNVALKPVSVDFSEAGALPLAGVSALQALTEHINVQSGQKILIQGGTGGIGHLAIQIAKSLGAYVATTVGPNDIEFAKSLGADEVIDYKSQKFEELLKEYDAVFDTIGGETTDLSFRVLKKGGILVSMVGEPKKELAEQYGVVAIGQGTHTDSKQLQALGALVDSGKVKVHLDSVFPLEQIQDAFSHQEKDHTQGKVGITIR